MNDSLISSVLQQHQGLSIRPEIKQTLADFRKNNFSQYLSELKAFLYTENVRFHIRLLVTNQLAATEYPTDDEWRIVKSLLDTDPEFTMNFIEAIQSEQWLNYLIHHGYIHTFLTSSDDKLFNLALWKLQSLIDTCTETVVDFLENFPTIEQRDERISGILLNLTHWEYPKAVQLFEQYLPTFKTFSERYPYYRILNSVFPYQPERVCQIFFDDLYHKIKAIPSTDEFDKQDVFDYQDIELFQKIRDHEETRGFALSEGIMIIRQLVEKTRLKSRRDFYHDGAFLFFEKFGSHLHDHWMFFALVKEDLIAVAQHNKPRFLELTAGFETSYALTLLKLLIQGYLTNPEEYVQEGFAVLSRPGILAEMTGEDSGGYEVRSLLNRLYPFFSITQQEIINALILSIKPDWERLQRRGFSMYRLLCVIPDDHLKQHPSIAKVYDEMERKFGDYKETPPEVSEFVEVGPPLPEQAYQKMTLEQWLSSFKRYDESTGWDQPGEDFLKGGIVEHSRRFTEEVSKRPEDFYEFVFSLGQRDDIPLMYLEAGINGLVKAQYDLEKVKTLVKTYWRFSDSGFRRAIIWAIDYINKQDVLDLELIEIFEEYMLHDPDPAEESWKIKTDSGTAYYGGDPLNSGINTVRGAAASQLATHGYKTSYPDKVFEIMQQAAADPAVSVRCCLITDLQGMLRWDREKTYHIFVTLTQDKQPQIIKYGLPCLTYLMTKENFQAFIPHLKVAMRLDEQVGYQHVQDYVGQILMLAYVKNYPESKELLEEGFRISDHTKTGAIKFASKHLLEQNKEVAEKSKVIFQRFLDEDSEEIGRTYDTVFHAFEPKDFKPLYGLFEAYIKSKAASYAAHWFFEYMMQCIESEPEKCLDLLQHYLNIHKSDTQRGIWAQRDKHVQILIGAYNKLTDTEYKEKAMDIFDAMLKDRAYKREGLKVLEEQDRG